MSNNYEGWQPETGDRAPEAKKAREVMQRLSAFVEKLRKKKVEHSIVVNNKEIKFSFLVKELIDGRIVIVQTGKAHEKEGEQDTGRLISLKVYRRTDGLPSEIHEFYFDTADFELQFFDRTNQKDEDESDDSVWRGVREKVAKEEMGISAASRENVKELEGILDLLERKK